MCGFVQCIQHSKTSKIVMVLENVYVKMKHTQSQKTVYLTTKA